MTTSCAVASRTLLFFFALVLGACASTDLAESWVDPGTKELPHFQRVFVAYLGADTAAQRLAEDSLAKHLAAPEVLKCYALFPDARGFDPARLREELRAKGCDGAVLMRLARVEQQVSAIGGYPAYDRSFGGYWGHAYETPVDVHTDEVVHVETNAYSLTDDKLLYSARSKTFNPQSTSALIDGIAAAIAEDLEEKGLRR